LSWPFRRWLDKNLPAIGAGRAAERYSKDRRRYFYSSLFPYNVNLRFTNNTVN
jgi:hypothetical protein